MKSLIWASFVLAIFMVNGCAPQKPLTPEEIAAERARQMAMVTRVYPDKKPEEVLLASARIFSLADDDYTVSHSPTSIQAQRNWLIYLVISAAMGTDTWIVEVAPEGEGTRVVARHSGQAASVTGMAMPTSNGGMSATAVTSPAMQNMTTQPAIYQLFFARLDHLMGKRADWVTCKDAGKLFTDGFLDPFCTVANDRTPDGKSSAQRRANEEQNKSTSGVSIGG
ncbi:hypothetical protein [Desulfovibrio falkowii]|uniref:Lipoprotein n=1 Tax=Desulfovibrio falkowii TaxID=3136602 RepID=A0ABQ0EA88_9BACT